jgi:hypothetical protein
MRVRRRAACRSARRGRWEPEHRRLTGMLPRRVAGFHRLRRRPIRRVPRPLCFPAQVMIIRPCPSPFARIPRPAIARHKAAPQTSDRDDSPHSAVRMFVVTPESLTKSMARVVQVRQLHGGGGLSDGGGRGGDHSGLLLRGRGARRHTHARTQTRNNINGYTYRCWMPRGGCGSASRAPTSARGAWRWATTPARGASEATAADCTGTCGVRGGAAAAVRMSGSWGPRR